MPRPEVKSGFIQGTCTEAAIGKSVQGADDGAFTPRSGIQSFAQRFESIGRRVRT